MKNKLTTEEIITIYTSRESHSDVAERYGVHTGTVYAIRSGSLHAEITKGLPAPVRYKRKIRKLTDQDVRDIRQSSMSLSQLAQVYGVDPSTISLIKNRKRRQDVE